ncbi:hypothetical protein COCON_G00085350 [Conger conger]|uniref:POF1B helix-loop-helix domain-containing protein n=1 Tax=Conger conger TaxID=82655 RepID=A0A9Q1DQI2_CONCO|nr:hypothetical protein COCON_G00085350 [Conger conger]
MSVPLGAHGVSSYRTVNVSSETLPINTASTVQYTTNEVPTYSSYRTVGVPVSQVSPVQYGGAVSQVQYGGAVNQVQYGGAVSQVHYGGAADSNVVYGTMRYLVPVERRVMPTESYMIVQNSAPQIVSQAVSPVYLRNYSVSSQEDLEIRQRTVVDGSVNGKTSSVVSQVSSPEPAPQEEEVEEEEEEEEVEEVVEEVIKREVEEVIEVQPVIKKVSRVTVRSEVPQIEPQAKLDTRFFGELLADIYRKNCDIHTCISDHVSKIRGRKHSFTSSDFTVRKDEVEGLIPKGLSELTKQQIRYLLQTRMTADSTMRLLLATFSNLREELAHLQGDLKASLKESSNTQRTLETQLVTTRTSESSRDFRVKDLEGRLKAMEKEKDMLLQKLAGQGSSSSLTLQTKTEELSRHYNQMLSSLREEKDKELQLLKSQLLRVQTETSSQSSNDQSLQLRISELLSSLEQREITIKSQEEEIRRLKTIQQKTVTESSTSGSTSGSSSSSSSRNITKTTVTKRYSTQYPILGLLGDQYKYEGPVKESRTVVFESTGTD